MKKKGVCVDCGNETSEKKHVRCKNCANKINATKKVKTLGDQCLASIEPACDKPVVCKDFCQGHYSRLKRGLDVNVILRPPRAGAVSKHSGYGTRLYKIWAGMKQRCLNHNNPYYERYGPLGVCEDWMEFTVFQSWATNNGYSDDLSLNRIDNDGPYTPDNCEWATQSEQMRNTRRSNVITIGCETKTMVDWSEDARCEVGYSTLRARLQRGWGMDEALLRK